MAIQKRKDKVEVKKGLRRRIKGAVKNTALYPTFADSTSVDKLLGSGHEGPIERV